MKVLRALVRVLVHLLMRVLVNWWGAELVSGLVWVLPRVKVRVGVIRRRGWLVALLWPPARLLLQGQLKPPEEGWVGRLAERVSWLVAVSELVPALVGVQEEGAGPRR